MYWDSTYILVLIGAALCTLASWNVSRTYARFGEQFSRNGMKAEEVAARMLREAGITDVQIQRVAGNLTDHYSPKEKYCGCRIRCTALPRWLPSVLPPTSADTPFSTTWGICPCGCDPFPCRLPISALCCTGR